MNRAANRAVDWAGVRARLEAMASQTALDATRRQELLQQRAAQLAKPIAVPEAGNTLRVLQLQLATQRCALETRFVTEVKKPSELTKLPGGPAHLLGLMNLRGEILPVFDLRVLMHSGQSEAIGDARYVVLGRAAPELGLFVERVDEIIALPESQILAVKASTVGASAGYVRGVTHSALVVIDAQALLESRELYLGDDDSNSSEANP